MSGFSGGTSARAEGFSRIGQETPHALRQPTQSAERTLAHTPSGKELAYFGYGSLVNPDARSRSAVAIPAVARGWIRQWRHCSDEGVKMCALTVERRTGVTIAGVLLIEDEGAVAIVDEREYDYHRQSTPIQPATSPAIQIPLDPFLYVANNPRWGDQECPILRTYVDCVLSGYIRTFGYDGAVEFAHTTEGWDCPIYDDRRAPLYPRAVTLSSSEREAIEEILLSVR